MNMNMNMNIKMDILEYLLYVLSFDNVVFSALHQFKNESIYVINIMKNNLGGECLITYLLKNWVLHILTSVYMMIVVYIIARVIYDIIIGKKMVFPTRVQYFLEYMYLNFSVVITEQLDKKGTKFYYYLITLFIIIFMLNVTGLIPYTTTITAQIAITFTLSMGVLFSLILLVIKENKENFIAYFIPSGTPIMMIPYIMIIELISFLSKGFSLGIRLTANMFAGHVLLNIISKGIMYFFFISNVYFVIVGIALLFLILLIGLETLIAFLQSYVFVILTTIYIKEIYEHNLNSDN